MRIEPFKGSDFSEDEDEEGGEQQGRGWLRLRGLELREWLD